MIRAAPGGSEPSFLEVVSAEQRLVRRVVDRGCGRELR
jgi:hypothetical protein